MTVKNQAVSDEDGSRCKQVPQTTPCASIGEDA